MSSLLSNALAEASLSGTYLTSKDSLPIVIDFALTSPDNSALMVLFPGWIDGNVANKENSMTGSTSVVARGRSFVAIPSGYTIEPINPLEDEELYATFRDYARVRRVDYRIPSYLKAVELLKSASPEYDFDPWVELVKEQSGGFKTDADYDRYLYGQRRTVYWASLVDMEGRVIDVLVGDAERADTAGINGWLADYAKSYTALPEKSLESLHQRFSRATVTNGALRIDSGEVLADQSGLCREIASSLLSSQSVNNFV